MFPTWTRRLNGPHVVQWRLGAPLRFAPFGQEPPNRPSNPETNSRNRRRQGYVGQERAQRTQKIKPMNTSFLPPIEKPKGLIKNLVYAMTRKQFGKVPTPVKVHAARLPTAFGMFYGKISTLDKKLQLYDRPMSLSRDQGPGIKVS